MQAVFTAAALGCALLLTAPAAFAQHVVTDFEAGKLTLYALTATPRPIYRPIVAFRRIHHAGFSRVAYHRRVSTRSRWH